MRRTSLLEGGISHLTIALAIAIYLAIDRVSFIYHILLYSDMLRMIYRASALTMARTMVVVGARAMSRAMTMASAMVPVVAMARAMVMPYP